MATSNLDRWVRLRARAMQGSALAATAVVALAVAPVAGAHALSRFGGFDHHPSSHFDPHQSSLQPNSLVISGTVFPGDGINLTAGQNLPSSTRSPEVLRIRRSRQARPRPSVIGYPILSRRL